MACTKGALLDPLVHKTPSRRKVYPGFGLVICAFFIVLSLIFFVNSSRNYHSTPIFQTTDSSVVVSWSLSFPNAALSSISSTSNVKTTEANVSSSDENAQIDESTRLSNLSRTAKNGNENTTVSNLEVKDVSFHGGIGEASFLKKYENYSAETKGKLFRGNDGLGNSRTEGRIPPSDCNCLQARSDYKFSEKCDIFHGRWVRDDSKPYYPPGSCPYVDKDFNCHLNERPDDGYLRWKWQPYGCNIPSLNATDFLERLRGKKLVFVGDSLNRNMWESLVCILRHSIRDKRRVYEISGRTEFKKKGIYAFRFEDYNTTVDFVSSPFLVQESLFQHTNGTLETLRLDSMDRTTSMYHDADIIVFNTGHWWTHAKTSRGEDYYQEGDYVHPQMKVHEAYKKALTTWARWVDQNIDSSKTRVFFRGYSVTHFRGGQWNSGGQCHRETEPIFNGSYLGQYPAKMKALERVLSEMKTPVVYLNISRLTDYRKDGHPSIYRKVYRTAEERVMAERVQDCSHWCLPGVPDTWNELLYSSILEAASKESQGG